VTPISSRLRALREGTLTVRLNLSEITFMDSVGLGFLINAVQQSRRNGWGLEIEHDLPPSIKDRFKHSGLGGLLGW
jgi:anti-anti-sigma factor